IFLVVLRIQVRDIAKIHSFFVIYCSNANTLDREQYGLPTQSIVVKPLDTVRYVIDDALITGVGGGANTLAVGTSVYVREPDTYQTIGLGLVPDPGVLANSGVYFCQKAY
nr:desmoglein 1 precursor - bovine (fragments) [Bos taurus]